MEPDTPPRTWKRAKWAWKLFKAARSEANGEYDRGLRYLEAASQIKALDPKRRVLKAKLLFLSQRLDNAQTAFASLRKELDGSGDPNLQYLRHYCSSMLAKIRMDMGHVQHQAKLAQSIPCSRYLRRKFPLIVLEDD